MPAIKKCGPDKKTPDRRYWKNCLRGPETVRPYRVIQGKPGLGESVGHDPSRNQGYGWRDFTASPGWVRAFAQPRSTITHNEISRTEIEHEDRNLMNESGLKTVQLIGGGIIPDEDAKALMAIDGISGIFGPGTDTREIIAFIEGLFKS